MCHLADAVLAGGIRRAALISLFSADDEKMLSCKSGTGGIEPAKRKSQQFSSSATAQTEERLLFNLWEKIKSSGSGEPDLSH